MPPLTADFDRRYRDGVQGIVKLQNEKVFFGSLLEVDANGYAKAATAGANKNYLGVAQKQVDNSQGADGDESVLYKRGGLHLFADNKEGGALVIGNDCYVVDDATVSKTVTNRTKLGKVIDTAEDDMVWVTIE